MESTKNINISGKKNICGLLLINETAETMSNETRSNETRSNETRSNANNVIGVNEFSNSNYYRKRAACEKWNLPEHHFQFYPASIGV